jgi:hypothetical protein
MGVTQFDLMRLLRKYLKSKSKKIRNGHLIFIDLPDGISLYEPI